MALADARARNEPTVPSKPRLALLPDRGVVSVTGPEARAFLDNLITNDMALLDAQDALHAGLLSPQGKILFAFFVVRTPAGYLLETSLDKTAELAKRLTLYKLRARIERPGTKWHRDVMGQAAEAARSTRLLSPFVQAEHGSAMTHLNGAGQLSRNPH